MNAITANLDPHGHSARWKNEPPSCPLGAGATFAAILVLLQGALASGLRPSPARGSRTPGANPGPSFLPL